MFFFIQLLQYTDSLNTSVILRSQEIESMYMLFGGLRNTTLLYKATKDGFEAAAFHLKCDNQGKTLTIIQANNFNYVFGGYTEVSWGADGYRSDFYPFLFSLRVNGNSETKRFDLVNQFATFGSMYGPTFGISHVQLEFFAYL